MKYFRTPVLLLLFALVILVSTSAIHSADKKKQKSGPKINTAAYDARIAAARSAASTMNAELERYAQEAATAGADVNRLKQELDEGTQNLKVLEQEIEDSQPEKSDFMLAKRKFEQATNDYQASVSRALSSREYKAAAQSASGSELGELRARTLKSDSDVLLAKREIDEARTQYEKLQRGVVESDSRWYEANQHMISTRAALKQAKSQLGQVLTKRGNARSELGRAVAAIATLESAKARAQHAAILANMAKKKKAAQARKQNKNKKKKNRKQR